MTGDEDELTTWTLGAIKSAAWFWKAPARRPTATSSRFDLDGLIGGFGADWRVPATLPVRCSLCGEPLTFLAPSCTMEQALRRPHVLTPSELDNPPRDRQCDTRFAKLAPRFTLEIAL